MQYLIFRLIIPIPNTEIKTAQADRPAWSGVAPCSQARADAPEGKSALFFIFGGSSRPCEPVIKGKGPYPGSLVSS